MQAGRQGMQVTWSMWQPTFKYKYWEYVGYTSNRVHTCMREPTSKVDMQQHQRQRGGESDGSCHNTPTTNHPIPNSQFQNDNKIRTVKRKCWWQRWWWRVFAVEKVSNPEPEIPAVFSLGDKQLSGRHTCTALQSFSPMCTAKLFSVCTAKLFSSVHWKAFLQCALDSMTCRIVHSSIGFHPNTL